MVVPPIVNEIRSLPADLHAFYMYLRQTMGPFAQGPVALIARHRDECVFSADALGLRPLWKVETPDDYIFSSEPGVVSVHEMVSEPLPLGPGEKFLVTIDAEQARLEAARALRDAAPGRRALGRAHRRRGRRGTTARWPPAARSRAPRSPATPRPGPSEPVKVDDRVLAGFGWQRDDVKLCQQMASNGAEPIGSLGYDGPLAALSPERQNLADYFKETVAVVTNPAIDREREIEHFSMRAVFGRRPSIHDLATDTGTVETSFPVILGGHHDLAPLSDSTYRKIAREHQTYLLEDLWEEFRDRAAAIDTALLESETTRGAIDRIRQEAVKQVAEGAELVVLTDRVVYDGERRYLDPHLALSAVDQALKHVQRRARRGEPAPPLFARAALGRDPQRPRRRPRARHGRQRRLPVRDGRGDLRRRLLRGRLEPLRGAAQGHREGDLDDRHPRGARLRPPVLLDRDPARARRDLPDARRSPPPTRAASASPTSTPTPTPATRSSTATRSRSRPRPSASTRRSTRPRSPPPTAPRRTQDYSQKVRDLEAAEPDLDAPRDAAEVRPRADRPRQVDAGVGHHDYPIVISSMSFGSQSEPAFRAYAEAAKATNILCVNGEGGEIRDMYGHYRKWRGQQVASGRFGVSAEMLNASYLAEIKIGQGAKPGEGGHLPGKKVSEKVAAARNAAPGTDLISPSNNHDLYSIEDLAELIDELKTVNPDVRVSVKVPGRPEHRHDRPRHRQGGRRHHHPVGLRGRHRRRAPARAAPRRPALRHRHAARPPGPDGGRDPQPRRDLGRRRLPPRPRHRQAALHGRQPHRVRHPGDGLARLHDLPRLPARHLPRRDRDPDRDRRGGAGARPEEVHAAGRRHGRRELRPLLHRDGRGGQGGRRVARLRPRPGPRRPLRPARAGLARQGARPRPADHPARGVPRARAGQPAGRRLGAGRIRGARRGGPGPGAADPDGALRRVRPDRRARRRRLRRQGRAPAVPAGHRRQRPRARHRALGGALARPPLRRRSRGHRGRAGRARVQRRLGRRPGLRRLQRLGGDRPRRGRRPGRRRQDDARRHRLDHEGPQLRRRARQRLGRQVVRLRRAARPAVRAGLGRLALLHPPLRRRRGARRRARRAARRRPRAASSTAPTPRASPSST